MRRKKGRKEVFHVACVAPARGAFGDLSIWHHNADDDADDDDDDDDDNDDDDDDGDNDTSRCRWMAR